MQTYTHFLWALVLSQWIIHRQQKISKSNNDNNNHTTTTTTTKWMVAPPSFHQIGVLIGSVLPDMALILTAIVCMVHDHIIYHTTSINTADYVNFNDNDNDENSSDSSSSSVVVYSNTTWTHQLFSDWYFNSPWVKAIHNIFHSPISLGILILITYLIFVYTTTSSTSRSGGGGRGGGRGGEDVDGDGKKKELPRRSRKNNNNNNNRSSCCCCNDSNCNMNSSSSFFFWVFISAMFHSLCDIPVHHDDGPLILWPFNWYYRYESPISYYDPNYYGHQFTIVEHTIDFIIIIYECYRCCCCFISSRRQRQRQQQQQQQRDSQHLLEVGGGTESDNGDGNDGDDNDKGRTEFTTLL